MKKAIISLICAFAIGTDLFAQTENKKTETFKVYGNCNMCKGTIEGSLKKKDGVISKDWNTETKMIKVSYDPSKITLAQIKEKIANVGYDCDSVRAKDEAYNKLMKCCQYERQKK